MRPFKFKLSSFYDDVFILNLKLIKEHSLRVHLETIRTKSNQCTEAKVHALSTGHHTQSNVPFPRVVTWLISDSTDTRRPDHITPPVKNSSLSGYVDHISIAISLRAPVWNEIRNHGDTSNKSISQGICSTNFSLAWRTISYSMAASMRSWVVLGLKI